MFAKVLHNETNAVALLSALAVVTVARAANGPGPLSPGRIARGVLSNPAPRFAPGRGPAPASATGGRPRAPA